MQGARNELDEKNLRTQIFFLALIFCYSCTKICLDYSTISCDGYYNIFARKGKPQSISNTVIGLTRVQ